MEVLLKEIIYWMLYERTTLKNQKNISKQFAPKSIQIKVKSNDFGKKNIKAKSF